MVRRSDNLFKRTVTDIGGILLIVAAMLLGWLPGPLGIPLLLAGLGLLSINHEWAGRMLERIRENGIKIMDKLFIGSPWVSLFWDIATPVLFAGSMYLFSRSDSRLQIFAATGLLVFSIVIFLSNRKRLHHLFNIVRRKS